MPEPYTPLSEAGLDAVEQASLPGKSLYLRSDTPRARVKMIADLYPGYFAFVMATGIVSLSAHYHGFKKIALVLFGINFFAYFILWVLTLIRCVRYPNRVASDLAHHAYGPSFMTKSAATCVLGSQVAVMTPWIPVAKVFWCFGAILALVLMYAFFSAMTLCELKPTLETGIDGSWFLVSVAAESITILGTLVAPSMVSSQVVLFMALAAHLIGAILYFIFATLIFYRWMFFKMKPIGPASWIDMGALAITSLAAALLQQAAPQWALLAKLESFLLGGSILFWATSTWWIPLLLILKLVFFVRGESPLTYEPGSWAFVFPLGMYSVATFMLGKLLSLPFLFQLAALFAIIAFIVWVLTFVGMLRSFHHTGARFT